MSITAAEARADRASRTRPPIEIPRAIVSDEELFLRYREQGDRTAFEDLVHRYERELFNYLYRYLHNREMAEDVFQASFLRLHRKGHLFKKGRRLRPWLYRVATNLAIDAQRKAGRRPAISLDTTRTGAGSREQTLLDVVESATPGPLARVEERERQVELHRAVANLPDNLRLPLILAFFQGLKYREIAEILDLPEGTVKWQVHAAVKRLHDALHDLQPA